MRVCAKRVDPRASVLGGTPKTAGGTPTLPQAHWSRFRRQLVVYFQEALGGVDRAKEFALFRPPLRTHPFGGRQISEEGAERLRQTGDVARLANEPVHPV